MPFHGSILCALLCLMVLALPLSAQQDDDVRVYTEQGDNGLIDFYADSSLLVPVFVHVEFETLRNLGSSIDLPFSTALDAATERRYLFSLEQQEGRSASYSFRYRYSWGDPDTVQPDEDYLYTFPFAHGTKHQITQGYNGKFSHKGDNSYAIDFDLEEGTEIYAARGGLVVKIKEDSNRGGTSPQFSTHGNYVLVMHSDGTFGNYVHLKQNGAIVDVGETVRIGQLIAYSGDTGLSSGPHLHFDVRIPLHNGRMQSIPIKFKGPDNTATLPEESTFYYSYHEGKEPFPVSFGSELRNDDFADHKGTAQRANTIEIRSEQYDSSYVLFVANGFDYDVDAIVNIQLRSMSSTVPLPVTLPLRAGEERFLSILRPLKGAISSSFRSSITYRRN